MPSVSCFDESVHVAIARSTAVLSNRVNAVNVVSSYTLPLSKKEFREVMPKGDGDGKNANSGSGPSSVERSSS